MRTVPQKRRTKSQRQALGAREAARYDGRSTSPASPAGIDSPQSNTTRRSRARFRPSLDLMLRSRTARSVLGPSFSCLRPGGGTQLPEFLCPPRTPGEAHRNDRQPNRCGRRRYRDSATPPRFVARRSDNAGRSTAAERDRSARDEPKTPKSRLDTGLHREPSARVLPATSVGPTSPTSSELTDLARLVRPRARMNPAPLDGALDSPLPPNSLQAPRAAAAGGPAEAK